MAIQWTQFENEVLQYMDARIAKSEDEFCQFLITAYDKVIKTQAVDVNYGNRVLTTNVPILVNSTKGAFNIAKTDRNGSQAARVIESMIGSGLIAYWTGATLAPIIPPPSSISVVSNSVTTPGQPLQVKVINTSDSKLFVKSLSAGFRKHLMTVQGITVALVPQPSGPPIPVPFPFSGIN